MSKILLVTGASRGIGAATARLAADQGYDVCVNYASKADEAEAVADYVRSKGQRAITVQADVGKEADVLRLFQTCDAELGKLTAFYNNAGVVDVVTRLEEMTEASIERMMRINITGSFLCAREAVLRLSTKHGGPGGAIVNMSSAAARLGARAVGVCGDGEAECPARRRHRCSAPRQVEAPRGVHQVGNEEDIGAHRGAS